MQQPLQADTLPFDQLIKIDPRRDRGKGEFHDQLIPATLFQRDRCQPPVLGFPTSIIRQFPHHGLVVSFRLLLDQPIPMQPLQGGRDLPHVQWPDP